MTLNFVPTLDSLRSMYKLTYQFDRIKTTSTQPGNGTEGRPSDGSRYYVRDHDERLRREHQVEEERVEVGEGRDQRVWSLHLQVGGHSRLPYCYSQRPCHG